MSKFPTLILTSPARFPLGQMVITAAAREALSPVTVAEALQRHVSGDWGDVCPDDARENELALKEGFRLLSVYESAGVKFWVITEADRSATTVLLPDDY